MFPFTDHELVGWPVSAAELDPYYQLVAKRVGVCGEPDALNGYEETTRVSRRTQAEFEVRDIISDE